jgi:2-polyprenyl-3-methyl-5-hydroxy-6-metoxy-1,4-benzoquinol methylase
VVAVDRPSSIRLAEALYRAPEVEYIEADLAKDDLPEGPFDVAVMTDVYEHLEEEAGERLLGQIRERLSDFGLLVFSIPLAEGKDRNPRHVRTFKTAEDVLDEVGSHLAPGQAAVFIRIGSIAGQVKGTYQPCAF